MGLGCMALTGIYGFIETDVARATMHKALDLGVRLFDTAALYADGANETMLGDVLGDRDDVFVVTKFGLSSDGRGSLTRDSSPVTMRASVEASLKRLRRQRIDLLLQHRHDPGTPDEHVAQVAANLIREGKIAAFGLSGTGVERVERMGAMVAVAAVQNELSLTTPDSFGEPAQVARNGAMFMAHSPLGRGLLTGRSSRPSITGDIRSDMPQFRSAAASTIKYRLRVIDDVSARYAQSRAAIALAWVLDMGENIVPIPGARTPEQIEDATRATSIALTRNDADSLTRASRPNE